MSGVKWIKITTDMFDDEKISYIESLPEADAILITWIKLLTQAGKTNANGFIFLTEKIPYTAESLAHKFRRPLNTIKLALETLKRLDMIEFDSNGFLRIANWEKHQNIAGLEKIKEQNRLRQARYRQKQKQLESHNSDNNASKKDVTLPVTSRNDIDIDIELERDKEQYIVEQDKPARPGGLKKQSEIIGKDPSVYKEVIDYLNAVTKKSYRKATKAHKTIIQAREKEGFTLADFKKVIDIKASQWLDDPERNKYLRPATLFNGSKMDGYLQEKSAPQKKKSSGWSTSAHKKASTPEEPGLMDFVNQIKAYPQFSEKEKQEAIYREVKNSLDEILPESAGQADFWQKLELPAEKERELIKAWEEAQR